MENNEIMEEVEVVETVEATSEIAEGGFSKGLKTIATIGLIGGAVYLISRFIVKPIIKKIVKHKKSKGRQIFEECECSEQSSDNFSQNENVDPEKTAEKAKSDKRFD